MHTTALPPGFVPRTTALVNTFVSHRSSSALVKRHLQRNTFHTVYGIEIEAMQLQMLQKPLSLIRVNVQNLPDSRQVVEDAVWFVEPFAFKKGQTISVNCESLTLQADEDTLKRILINLISNAINFSPAKSNIEVKRFIRSRIGNVQRQRRRSRHCCRKFGIDLRCQSTGHQQVRRRSARQRTWTSICKELVQALLRKRLASAPVNPAAISGLRFRWFRCNKNQRKLKRIDLFDLSDFDAIEEVGRQFGCFITLTACGKQVMKSSRDANNHFRRDTTGIGNGIFLSRQALKIECLFHLRFFALDHCPRPSCSSLVCVVRQ